MQAIRRPQGWRAVTVRPVGTAPEGQSARLASFALAGQRCVCADAGASGIAKSNIKPIMIRIADSSADDALPHTPTD